MAKINWKKVNNEKTELCLFYRQVTALVNFPTGDLIIKSKSDIIVLGVLFDSKLQWSNRISK